jgi:hypothetical protein
MPVRERLRFYTHSKLADGNDQPAYAQQNFQQLEQNVGSKELHIGDAQHPRHKEYYTQRNKHDTLDSRHGTTSFTSWFSQTRLCFYPAKDFCVIAPISVLRKNFGSLFEPSIVHVNFHKHQRTETSVSAWHCRYYGVIYTGESHKVLHFTG